MTFNFLEGLPFQRLLPPNGLIGWLAWLALGAGIALLLWRQRKQNVAHTRQHAAWFLGLGLLTPITILLLSVRLSAGGGLPIPALGPPALGPLMPVLAAVPWVAGLALLGPLPGALLAALAGMLLSFWDTRSPFTLLEFASLAAVFSVFVRQDYGTRFYAFIRRPFVAGLLVSALYPFLYILTSVFWASTDPVASLDFALSRVGITTISVAAPLLVASVLLELLRGRFPSLLTAPAEMRPAPSERSLEGRLLFTLGPIVLLAFLALAALGWWSAGQAAERLLGDRVRANAELAADSVPFLLETGQSLILQLAEDTRLADASPADALALLQNHLRAVPYFEQVTLLDTGGNTIAGFPVSDFLGLQPQPEEIAAANLAVQGMALQFLSVPPLDSSANSAELSFIAAVHNANGQVRAVLVGRTNLASNPFAQPIVQSLQSVNDLGGQGFLLDNERRIVLAPTPAAIMQPYNGRTGSSQLAYEDSGADGSRRFVDYVPVTGSSWAVVTLWPARLSQQLSLEIALPLLLVLLVLAGLAFLLLRASLRSVTGSLQQLVGETRRIAAGDLSAPLPVRGTDEVGRLRAAFESMRQNLQARVEENQRLLTVSQGVGTNLDAGAHIDPILEAALASGASSARLVFNGDGNPVGFGKGAAQRIHQILDEQMLSLTREQDRVLLTNPARARLKAAKGTDLPQTVAAFALENNGEHLGALWLAYESPQTFSPEAVRYLETLADQAAKAAVNARLYTSASLGRQRMEAVLHANPDALLLLDERQRIVFANAAAQKVFKLQSESLNGRAIVDLVGTQAFTLLFNSGEANPHGSEVKLLGNAYHGVVSLIRDGQDLLGIVLTLRDTSVAKQIDSARADFLTTLSHDLHDPLDLTRGYLNMLGMVGDLSPQQQSYVQKMEHNLENISRLAMDLLDIERVSGLKSLQLQSFSLPELIREVIDDLSPRSRQKKIEVTVQNGQGSPVQADRTLVQRALYNLLDNAIKFSPRDGLVEVRTRFDAERVKIAVTDQGGGVAPLDLPHIFEAGKSKRRSTGLAIVKSIAERHGGRVWAESELGTGSSFYLELPIQPATKV